MLAAKEIYTQKSEGKTSFQKNLPSAIFCPIARFSLLSVAFIYVRDSKAPAYTDRIESLSLFYITFLQIFTALVFHLFDRLDAYKLAYRFMGKTQKLIQFIIHIYNLWIKCWLYFSVEMPIPAIWYFFFAAMRDHLLFYRFFVLSYVMFLCLFAGALRCSHDSVYTMPSREK